MIDEKALLEALKRDKSNHDNQETLLMRAKNILQDLPPELNKNIQEYINGEPFSDIKIHDLSLSDVLQYWNADNWYLADAIEALNFYKNNPKFGKQYIVTKFLHDEVVR